MEILDGKKLQEKLLLEYKEKIINNNLDITLAIILIGENEASKIYVKNKLIACEKIGIKTKLIQLEESITKEEIVKIIKELNNDKSITGIILQSPIANHLDFDYLVSFIKPSKDIDGFTNENFGKLSKNEKTLIPCTVKGIIKLLEYYNVDLTSKNVVIVGRSKIVGLPLSIALLNKNATVTITHSKTKNLENITSKADILIVAIGKSKYITSEYVKEDAIVVDVGISRVDGKIYGDVDFDNVAPKCRMITKTPGGVGPMTVAMIIDNLILAKEMENNG